MKKQIVDLLKYEKEIEKIIIFGSFNKSDNPNDIDIAVVQNSNENYYSAKILLESNMYNPCLHNIQQSIEKALKSLFIENNIPFVKTQSIIFLNKS